MSKKRYKDLGKLIEHLNEICPGIAEGGKELAKGVNEFKEGLKKQFFFFRLLIKKEFESGTGMGFDEWVEFGNELSKRFEDISSAIEKVYDFHSKFEFERIPESIEELDHVASPFLNNYDQTIKTLDKLQNFMAEIPNGIKSVPSIVMSDEEKRTMAEDSLVWAADLKKLIVTLDDAKTKILTIKNFK